MKIRARSNIRKFGVVLSCYLVIFAAFFCPSSHAAEISSFAGADIDDHGQGFSYLGVDVTHKLDRHIGITGKVIPNYLAYKYKSGDQEIKAKAPGLFLVGGAKYFWDKSMIGLFGGGEFRDTDLSPDDPGSSVRGNTSSALIQGELDSWFSRGTNLYANASYSFKTDFAYEKAKIRQQITNRSFQKPYSLYLGVEQFFGRNPDFQQEGVGVLLEVYHLVHRVSVAVKSGYKHDSSFGNGAYWGLDLYKGF
jgi:hypothetical protein